MALWMFVAWCCHANVSYIQKKHETSGPDSRAAFQGFYFDCLKSVMRCLYPRSYRYVMCFLMYTMFIQFLGKQKDGSARRSAVSGKKILLKLDKTKEDNLAENNRNELLKFLNASYD
ncbi:uncharacterized protein LOC121796440 [Salvia splendens]|uniref:uncharacterized protein LOC121796440 n=1 Tax=Salvia splendens TaxID=180675 RepID=UPI001C252586|nr:uncharacterized protein LOC121796440 [Salvia splendens]